MTGTNETGVDVLERLVANVADGNLIDSPDWSDCFQSWRAYIPPELRPLWGLLPREAKLIAAILGDELVERENLD